MLTLTILGYMVVQAFNTVVAFYLLITEQTPTTYVPKARRFFHQSPHICPNKQPPWYVQWMAWIERQHKHMQRRRRLINALNKTRNEEYHKRFIPSYKKRRHLTAACIAHQALAMAAHLSSTTIAMPTYFDTDSALVGIDNRASACMSDDIRDFVGPLTDTDRVVRGFAGSRTSNVQKGTIEWCIEDDQGKVSKHRIPNSYYVPDGKVRLFSPQHWAATLPPQNRPKKDQPPECTFHNRVQLTWNRGESTKTVWLDPATNVATFTLAPGYKRYHDFCAEAITSDWDDQTDPCVLASEIVEDTPQVATRARTISFDMAEDTKVPMQAHNIDFDLDGPTEDGATLPTSETEAEHTDKSLAAEFLRFHHKFNHASPKRLRKLAELGVIPKRLATCPVPACTACMYGKATKKPWRSKPSHKNADISPPPKPGQVVSVDQLVSPTAGLVAQISGKNTKIRYTCATVFVDQASDLSFIVPQKTASAEETVEAKVAFERYARQLGVNIQHYHCDNGVFQAKAWANHCEQNGQGLTFTGVNAHHQNGRAERRICELQQLARTMLIHAQRRWPSAVNAHLWPYAIRMANDALNVLPSLKHKDGRTPMSIFANTSVDVNPRQWHHFACPVYVLEAPLQSGSFMNKWKERSRVGLYLGRSPQHAQSVALVLNLQTGLVSPQFHVAFDPMFHTMTSSFGEQQPTSQWQERTGLLTENQYDNTTKDNFLSATADTSMPEGGENPRRKRREGEPVPKTPATHANTGDSAPISVLPMHNTEHDHGTDTPHEASTHQHEVHGNGSPSDPIVHAEDNIHERHNPRPLRLRRPVQRLIEAMSVQVHAASSTMPIEGELFSLQAMFPDDTDNDTRVHPLHAFGASADPDVLYYHEAMKAPDKQHFLHAMKKEVEGQLATNVYSLILRSDIPKLARILPAVWAMRRKRKAKTGEVYKYKGRLNIGGHKQRPGLDYEQTFAPVVTWPSIRLLLTLVLVHGWHTRQIDFVQAYPQAPVEREMYMEIPKGFEINKKCMKAGTKPSDYALQINRNIYGQKQAGRVWNQYLVQRLKAIGFTQSDHDECVFYKGTAIYILYTDDSILAGPDEHELDTILHEMKQQKLNITVEGTIEDFLGVNIQRHDNGTFELTQTRLIDSILEDLKLNDNKTVIKHTPAATSKILSRHPTSDPFDGHFHYRSVIGKLNYLEKCTHPDIAYAVHQCARFVDDPRKPHGQAVKWLGRYLYGTRKQGIIMRPDANKLLDLYVDSDWSGNWDRSIAATDSSTARSRHGYVLMYQGCPIFWASQLQTEIALSSTEAEYIGLSRALRETIPLIGILKELKNHGFQVATTTPDVHCTVFEDNSGAVEMATVHKLRPRTKHINIKYHHFRSHVDDGTIRITSIKSADNISDMLTKSQPYALLRQHRHQFLGWDVESEKGCNENSNLTNTSTGYNYGLDLNPDLMPG